MGIKHSFVDTQIYNQIRKKLIDALGGRFKEITSEALP